MGATYTRQESANITDGSVIEATHFNNEFNQLESAFASSTGHSHDGTTAEGGYVPLIADLDANNKIVSDTSNNRFGVFVEVGGSPVEQFRFQDGAIVPVTDNDIDLGTGALEFKDLYLDGTANIDTLVIGSSTGVTSVDTDLSSVSASDDTLASAKAIKTYIDAQVTAQDLDFQADTGGALSIDLDSETLTFTGGTGIDTSGASNAVTFAIDSTVATLTGTQTLTNKTVNLTNNTLTGTTAEFNTALSDGSFATLAGTETLTNKTVNLASNTLTGTTAEFNTALSDGSFATLAGTETLTNKTIDLASNTLTGTTAEFNTALSDGSFTTLAGSETLTNKTIDTANNTITVVEADISDLGAYITASSTDTLTNKTIDTANNTITIVEADISDLGSYITASSSDTLTNKSISLTTNTLTGTTAEFNTALSDGSFTTLAGTETLTNKTLTSPVLNTDVSGTAVLDDDTFATASDTTLATSESIKQYVDDSVATANELSELTDVNITTPSDGALLFYDTGTSKWIDNVVSGDITIADTGIAAISSGVIVNDDVNASAGIVYSKLSLSDSIVNADINSSAAIVDTKLDTITTADKVSGSAVQIDGATDGTGITVDSTDKLLIDDEGTTKYINISQLPSGASQGFAIAMAVAL
jgi:trimeric autotransporter adhesin